MNADTGISVTQPDVPSQNARLRQFRMHTLAQIVQLSGHILRAYILMIDLSPGSLIILSGSSIGSMTNQTWDEAISIKGLEAGWHLTRIELARGFLSDYLSADAFGNSLNANLVELRRKLLNGTYQPKALIHVSVPKGSLGTRPGSYISIEDRVVLWSIIKEIAPIFDKKLLPEVYSYRWQALDANDGIFREMSLGDLLHKSYLKREIIRRVIDPFEAWYEAWPEFEERSNEIRDDGYSFLTVSDISAYFENISLPILRDILLREIPHEQRIINHIMSCLESWAVSTHLGFKPHRGIPQGSTVCSFLGNVYLTGIDDIFSSFSKNYDIKYIRYMDDVRIFSREIDVARRVVFTLEESVRKFHLNLQSAKTAILSEESGREITNYVYDARMDVLNDLKEKIELGKFNDPRRAISKCYDLSRKSPDNPNCDRIIPIPRKLDHLTSRVSRRLMNLLVELGDKECGAYLFQYIERNMDFRFTRIFVNYIRKNPRKYSYQRKIIDFLESDENIFPHQEAELIGSVRYFSQLTPDTISYFTDRIRACDDDYHYTQIQLYRLAPRLKFDERFYKGIIRNLQATKSDEALCYKSLVMTRRGNADLNELIGTFERFPNAKISLYGRHLRHIFADVNYSRRFCEYVVDSLDPFKINDYLGLLPLLLFSQNKLICSRSIESLSLAAAKHPCRDIKDILDNMLTRAEFHLTTLTE